MGTDDEHPDISATGIALILSDEFLAAHAHSLRDIADHEGADDSDQARSARVMIVDDEPTTVEVVRMFLADAGYRDFITTTDPTEALTHLRELQPDVVLLDLMMPEIDGFEILAQMRKDPSLDPIPVIVLTSSADARTRLKALELGADDFLAKPVDRSELVLRLRNNLATKAYQDRVRREREKSDRLLLSILPEPVADRLKAGERTIADHFDEVTVLFADLVNFTAFASSTDASVVVERLNEIFQAFDELVGERGLEKIKTSGDSYMLAGGLPVPCDGHAEAVVDAGVAMLAAVDEINRHRPDGFLLRVGVHTGPVVAGVIGHTKCAYDLWGDTVNVASRMESQGVPGRVQISEATRQAMGGAFELEAQPPLAVKGKGSMRTYLVRERACRSSSPGAVFSTAPALRRPGLSSPSG